MHTRQRSLYFCMVKIQNFKHIHVQKNIKVGQFIETSIVKKLLGLKGLRNFLQTKKNDDHVQSNFFYFILF